LLVFGAGRIAAHGDHDGDADDGAHKNMRLVGFSDLQARSTYQPTLHKQTINGRTHYVIYAGHHPLAGPGEGQAPAGTPPLNSFNPLTGRNEENGTSIIDVTDVRHPHYLFHLPVPTGSGGGAQMVRVCNRNGREYMLRSYANSAHEIWDVTDPTSPQPVHTINKPDGSGGFVLNNDPTTGPFLGAQTGTPGALAGTHKNWWECDTGIAYIVGRRGSDTAAGWRAGNHILVFDLSNPAHPVFLRDWAMDGQQPGSKLQPHFTNAPAIHGPISTGPAGGPLSAIPGVVANRVYFAYGTGSTGIMQIVDRSKLLDPSIPVTDFTTAEIGHWVMNPDNGAHTSFPLGQLTVPDFVTDTGNDIGTVREFVAVTSEATANFCANQVRHVTFLVDITDPGRPQSVSTFQVPAASGAFCDRGGRFGPHATNEEFGPPFYQKLVFISQFNAGVRAVDVRDPYNPKDAAFFIPAINANTDLRCGPFKGSASVCVPAVQTNNVATDDRGFVYIVDRANSGMHILRLTGSAARIAGLHDGDDD
jgi:hypothetical protein